MRADHDITKLPKWAQSEISRLERNLAHAEAKLAEGPEDSDTFADPYANAPRPLGKGTRIEFVADAERRDRFHAHLTEDGILEVSGGSSLQIQPHAANVVRIKLGGYF